MTGGLLTATTGAHAGAMPTIARTDLAVHELLLPAGREVVVDLEGSPDVVEVVVTGPGSAPILWNAVD